MTPRRWLAAWYAGLLLLLLWLALQPAPNVTLTFQDYPVPLERYP